MSFGEWLEKEKHKILYVDYANITEWLNAAYLAGKAEGVKEERERILDIVTILTILPNREILQSLNNTAEMIIAAIQRGNE